MEGSEEAVEECHCEKEGEDGYEETSGGDGRQIGRFLVRCVEAVFRKFGWWYVGRGRQLYR